MIQTTFRDMPGISQEYVASRRNLGLINPQVLQRGFVLDGALSLDAMNIPQTELRAGNILGKVTATGKYAPSIIGAITTALASTGTSLKVAEAVANAINARIGSSGTFKITGPPTAAGVVRTKTVTYSAVTTVTALQATVTLTGAPGGGTFTLRYNGAITGDLAYDITAANLQTALRALSTSLGRAITVSGNAGGPYTITFPAPLNLFDPVTGDLLLVADGTDLTGNGDEDVTVAQTEGPVTITALGAASTWTVTAAGGTDGGAFFLKITTNLGTAISASIAYDATGAAIDAIIEAMANVGAGGVAVTGNAGGPWTFTFIADLDDVQMEVINDSTNDGTVWEGGVVLEQTQAGVDGRFIAGSLIQPDDGSETPLGVFTGEDGYGQRTIDVLTGLAKDLSEPWLLIACDWIEVSGLVNYPSDTSLIAWLKALLRAQSPRWVFSDDWF